VSGFVPRGYTHDPENDEICGDTFDHVIVITYEDEDTRQWECSNCGAEGWEDLNE
jgi:hypothetical protein